MRENDRILRMRGMKKMEAGVRILGFKLDRRILWMRKMKIKDEGGWEDSWDEGEWEDPKNEGNEKDE